MSGSTNNRRPSLRRTFSAKGPTMFNAMVATGAKFSTTQSKRQLSTLFANNPDLPMRLDRSNSHSDGIKRRIVPVPSPMARANSASGGSMSRKQAAIKSHPSQSRYSNKSVRDDHPKGDEPYVREDADVEIEELRTRASEQTTGTGEQTRNGSVTRPVSSTLKKTRLDWVVSKATTPQPLASSPSKLRLSWANPSGLLRPNVHISAQLRIACWASTLCIHSACASFYGWVAVFHAHLRSTKLAMLLAPYSPELLDISGYSIAACVITSVLGTIHATIALRMVRQSLACRQLMYYAPNYFNAARNDHVMPFSASMKALTGSRPNYPHGNAPTGRKIVLTLLHRLWWVLQEMFWARRDLLLLNYTPPSERMYRLTLLVQTVIHIYSTIMMSRRVSASWLHQTYLACIVLNAWLPIVLTLLRNAQLILWHTHRITSLLSSIALDIFGVLVIRIVLMLAYRDDYDASLQSFPAARLRCDRWLVKMLLEVHFLLAMDVLSTLLRVLQGLHLLSSLNALKSLLESVTSSRPPIPSTERSISGSPTRNANRQSNLIKVKPGNRYTVFIELLLVVVCVIPIAAYAAATGSKYPMSVCPLSIHPWFAAQPFCPLVEIDCAANTAIIDGGGGDDIATVLAMVNRQVVRHLVIRSCPSLAITPAIHELPNLLVFKIKSSSIASWPSDARLSQQTHADLRLFAAINVAMTALPDGLLGSDLPTKLTEIHLCRTNLSTLPSTLHTRWASVRTLVLERSHIDTVPETILRMTSMRELSLSGNNVSVVPNELLTLPRLETLYLNGNPVASLPLDVVPSTSLTLLAMDATDLKAVPVWAATKEDLLLLLGGTPFCEQADSATLSEIDSLGISCTRLANDSMTLLPLLLAEY